MDNYDEIDLSVTIKDFKQLIVWQKSMNLANKVYKICESFPVEEKYRLSNQIIRATTSISANIAEGNGQIFPKKNVNFVNNAIGSASEVRNWLVLARAQNYIDEFTFTELDEDTTEIMKMCIGYIRMLKVAILAKSNAIYNGE